MNTICAPSVFQIARMSRWVVCGLFDTIATFCPTSAFTSVDLPTLGRPTTATIPLRNPAGQLNAVPVRTAPAARSSSAHTSRSPSSVSATTIALGPNSHSTWRHAPHGGVGEAASVTMAIASRRLAPPSSIAATALRSAQTETG